MCTVRDLIQSETDGGGVSRVDDMLDDILPSWDVTENISIFIDKVVQIILLLVGDLVPSSIVGPGSKVVVHSVATTLREQENAMPSSH